MEELTSLCGSVLNAENPLTKCDDRQLLMRMNLPLTCIAAHQFSETNMLA